MADRLEELNRRQHAVDVAPNDPIALHNFASLLTELGRPSDAEGAVRRAMRAGSDAPESWLVLGRALAALNRPVEAEDALISAVTRRESYSAAHRELAELRWMRTGDVGIASQRLDRSLAIRTTPELVDVKTTLLVAAGHGDAAADLAEELAKRMPTHLGVRLAAARLHAQYGDPAVAIEHASAGAQMAPGAPDAASALCEALFADGRISDAYRLTTYMLDSRPFDQTFIAYDLTARRLLGGQSCVGVESSEELVSSELIDVPLGWSNLSGFASDLAIELRRLHRNKTHPFGQSVRNGSQVSNVHLISSEPIRAFFRSIADAIDRYITSYVPKLKHMSRGADLTYQLEGAWSVMLSSGGRHASHIHPSGWISSACHIDIPPEVEDKDDRQGWLAFGEPGIRTAPELSADHFVKPEPGRLVLFPSYLWHATTPFQSATPRLTIAFDLVPA